MQFISEKDFRRKLQKQLTEKEITIEQYSHKLKEKKLDILVLPMQFLILVLKKVRLFSKETC